MKMKKYLPFAGLLLPFVAFAQDTTLGQGFTNLVTDIGGLVELALPILFALGVVVFLWGMIKFLTAAGDEEGRKEGKKYVVWGLIFLAVVVALWGFIGLITNIFGIDTGGSVNVPGVNF